MKTLEFNSMCGIRYREESALDTKLCVIVMLQFTCKIHEKLTVLIPESRTMTFVSMDDFVFVICKKLCARENPLLHL